MKKQFISKILLTVFVVILLIIFRAEIQSIDSTISESFNKIAGEKTPDSSIVIIHITSEDIEQLGPWPLKRSYYALLINNLKKYEVKKIGLEIFLSAKFVSQAVYDNVLQKEILKANNLVLSSVAGSIDNNNNFFKTDSLSLPSPKLLNESIVTGHTNIIRNNGVIIPLEIHNQHSIEKSFSRQLSDKSESSNTKIKINFISSWKKFTNYSLIEFFDLVQSNDLILKNLRNKIVIIGVSDPQLSSIIGTRYDETIPGAALHAFALDNLLNRRYFNDSYYDHSILLFLLCIVIILYLFRIKNFTLNHFIIIISAALLFLFILNRFFFIELAYSFLLMPILVIFLNDFYYKIAENKNQIIGFYNESELLKKLLREKEKELIQLQKELNLESNQYSSELLDKIKELKNDIEKLKDNEEDQRASLDLNKIEECNFYGLVYRSTKMNESIDMIKKSAPTDATVLITGESGTGKELAARAIHTLSKRINYNFVAVNCAALTESLLESELFGHVKGSFTGARTEKIGKFESANNGTIFLDEIGETSENFQVKLLRVLQSGEYDKVGSEKTAYTNVRVISATNKDLKQLVREKKFREDLYYRLNVINIHLPALKERIEDIELITKYFLEKEEKKYQISVAALKSLNEYHWNGNVRELESVIKRAKVFCDSSNRSLIQLNDLPEEIIKNSKISFDDLVMESLRNKKFSHSSIIESAKELGNVNRTLVSENFRGFSLKILVENEFDVIEASKFISNSEDDEVNDKVISKLETWINNIRKDVDTSRGINFNEMKIKLNSKYKNLPQKYHQYLDEVIRDCMK
ncbi:MAG: sigma 54-interacting transcriptional regulator [Ignavibacteriaceae bacterium]